MDFFGAPEGPSWADLFPDTLAKIFNRLSLEDVLTIVPRVCRSWRRVSQDAVCWQVIDLDVWSHYPRSLATTERMVKMLVNRSCGFLREFSIAYLGNDTILRCIAQSGQVLKVLRIYNSAVTDYCVSEVAPKLSSIIYLDISGCMNMSKVALEAFGQHCKCITHLKRNMYPANSGMVPPNDDEALAIAQHMPQLKHLEISYALLSNTGLKVILEKCASLEFLDLRGCWFLDMEEAFVKECKKKFKVFLGPVVENDIYNTDDANICASDYYDDSSGTVWCDSDFDDLSLDMHEEEINGTLYFWPDSSP